MAAERENLNTKEIFELELLPTPVKKLRAMVNQYWKQVVTILKKSDLKV